MINLNHPSSLTIESVKDLLRSKDDSQHRQIRVMSNGDVVLSDDIGNINLTGVKFQFDTLIAGNGYTGQEAADDAKWVETVRSDLEKHWAKGSSGHIEF